MQVPSPIDPDILSRMWHIVATAIATRRCSLAEAAAEARGFAWGRHPALPAATIDEAVTGILREFGVYIGEGRPVEQDGAVLVPAAPEAVADALAYAMRFDERGKARRTGAEYASELAAEQLVRQLQASNFVVMHRVPQGG
jgi:hypothetical protein